MKYIIAIFLLLSFAFPALAAKEVSGSVPVVQPLQAPSAIAHANVSNNIELQSKANGEAVAPNSGVQSEQEATTVTANNAAVASGQIQTKPSSGGAGYLWILWIIVILCLFVVGWWVWKTEKVK